jgi:hypothetical protein
MAKGRRSRSVYDPSIGGDRLEKTGVFDRDPLAMLQASHDMEDIRGEILDPGYHQIEKGRTIRWKLLVPVVVSALVVIIVVAAVGGKKHGNNSYASNAVGTQVEETPTDFLAPPVAELAQICSEQNLATPAGPAWCATECNKAECCNYNIKLSNSCLTGNEQTCLDYHQSCWILDESANAVANPSLKSAPSSLPSACSETALSTADGIAACQNMCQPAECCYLGGVDSCASNAVCDSYAPCLLLRAMQNIHDDIPRLIGEACADDKLQNGDITKCQQLCSQSLCCFLPVSECNLSDYSFCTQYAKCADIMGEDMQQHFGTQDDSLIPLPPDNLDQICDDKSLSEAVGRAACVAACEPHNCCNEDLDSPTSCFTGNADLCQQYHSACWVLDMDTTEVVETPEFDATPELLGPTCSLEALESDAGIAKCRQICEEAACCWQDSGTSCAWEDACEAYSMCFVLRTIEDDSETTSSPIQQTPVTNSVVTLLAPPKFLPTVCSEQKVLVEKKVTECSTYCEKSDCCYFSVGQAGACMDGNQESCQQYHASCWILDPEAVRMSPLPLLATPQTGSLDEMCDLSNTVVSSTGCSYLCQAAKCCFSDSQDGPSCAWLDVCKNYAMCFSLAVLDTADIWSTPAAGTADTSLELPPDDLAAICSATNLASQATRIKCEETCNKSNCCYFQPWEAGFCLEDNHYYCQFYHASCWALDSTTIELDSPPTLVAPPTSIDEVCALSAVETPAGYAACQKICDAATCCFDSGDRGPSCAWLEMCAKYSMCLSLYAVDVDEDGDVDEIYYDETPLVVDKTDIDTACSLAVRSQCEALCAQATCCKSGSCSWAQPTLNCAIYNSCKVLYD